MKIHLVNQSKQSIGGGWTFLRTFDKYLKRIGVPVVSTAEESEVVFISGATMVTRDDVMNWKNQGKKIVLRIDNIPRNSRNRNTGTSRLYDFAQVADLVIFQSEWARKYIGSFIKKHGEVIINGADTDFFHPEGDARPADGRPQFLYVQYNRDETKQWHQAWYEYIMRSREMPSSNLWIVGNFSPEQQAYNFDFFQGEKFEYLGVQEDPADMAEIYRGSDVMLFPYFNDACSNTLVEFRLCKDLPHKEFQFSHLMLNNDTGGNREILNAPLSHLTAEHMTARYVEEISKIMRGA